MRRERPCLPCAVLHPPHACIRHHVLLPSCYILGAGLCDACKVLPGAGVAL